ncbi:MAG: hypothetical protein IJR50_00860 [Treponema sp.]|nr:hypothetical protein [Treponema sp.]
MRKLLVAFFMLPLLVACMASKPTAMAPSAPAQKALPAPTDMSKAEANDNPFAAAASSINVSNLFEYLGRDDVFYIDLRDFGDYQKKHLRNFECVPFFAYIYDKAAHTDASKVQLYGGETKSPVPIYAESDDLLEVLIPKDKTVFLMCQSGGRVAMCMQILEARGWDMSKIYNVGGMGQYTASQYADYTVNAPEFGVNAAYTINDVTRN